MTTKGSPKDHHRTTKGPPKDHHRTTKGSPKDHHYYLISSTLRSLSRLFGDFLKEFQGGILGDVRGCSGNIWRPFWKCLRAIYKESQGKKPSQRTSNMREDYLSSIYFLHYLPTGVYSTPYSMNSLFGEFFRKFSGVVLEVCETIRGSFWGCFERILKETPFTKTRKTPQTLFITISLFSSK